MFARAKTIAEERCTRPRPIAGNESAWSSRTVARARCCQTADVQRNRRLRPSLKLKNRQPANHDKLLAATVRLRVDEAQSHAYGTGTIIDSRSGQALVITCGHLFRESKGKGPVTVELFEPVPGGVRAAGQVRAQVISYNLERDIALVGIWPSRPGGGRAGCTKARPSVAATAWSASAAAMATIPLRWRRGSPSWTVTRAPPTSKPRAHPSKAAAAVDCSMPKAN